MFFLFTRILRPYQSGRLDVIRHHYLEKNLVSYLYTDTYENVFFCDIVAGLNQIRKIYVTKLRIGAIFICLVYFMDLIVKVIFYYFMYFIVQIFKL